MIGFKTLAHIGGAPDVLREITRQTASPAGVRQLRSGSVASPMQVRSMGRDDVIESTKEAVPA
jgi:hypothetical protein